MFRRKTSPERPQEPSIDTPNSVVTDETSQPTNKGRPTPSRKEAEAARKARLKPAIGRREQIKRDRQRMRDQRAKTREAMATGDERYFLKRDQGAVRKFVRDYVDSRRTVGEFFLPMIVVILLVSLVGIPQLQLIGTLLWLVIMVLLIIDMTILSTRVRREIRKRFPDESGKGHGFYAIARATQIRRLRLPKPNVKPGELV